MGHIENQMGRLPGAQPDAQPGAQPGQKFVLVAEDDKFYSNIFKIKLAKEGYEVVVVNNGEELLKAAREKKPDLIVLDLIMPIKDGFEVLGELKVDDSLKDVKVIVISNLGQETDIEKAKDLGATDHLTKANISLEEAMEKVKQHLG